MVLKCICCNSFLVITGVHLARFAATMCSKLVKSCAVTDTCCLPYTVYIIQILLLILLSHVSSSHKAYGVAFNIRPSFLPLFPSLHSFQLTQAVICFPPTTLPSRLPYLASVHPFHSLATLTAQMSHLTLIPHSPSSHSYSICRSS